MAVLDPPFYPNSVEFAKSPKERRFCSVGNPSLRQLVERLRSDKPLLPRERQWLADLLDPDGTTEMCLVIGQRKPGPNQSDSFERDADVYEKMRGLVEDRKMKAEAAVHLIIEDYKRIGKKIGRSTIWKIWSNYRNNYVPQK